MAKGGRSKATQPTPKSIKTNFRLNDKKFCWSFEWCFWNHVGWQGISVEFFVKHIIAKLQDYEKLTWQEILDASGGKAEGHGNNNHFIDVDKLPTDENRKLRRTFDGEVDKVFSLRLSGKERLIGVVGLNVFKILWFDAEHNFF